MKVFISGIILLLFYLIIALMGAFLTKIFGWIFPVISGIIAVISFIIRRKMP